MKHTFKGVKMEELERAYEKCLVWFYAYPRNTIGLSGLSRVIHASKTATKQAVENLLRQDFLFRGLVGKTWILSANQKHPYFIRKKVPYHLDKIYNAGILETIHRDIPGARAIILFGSYRWGSDTEESDIDIAVEVLGNHEPRIVPFGAVEYLGYRKKIPLNLYIFCRNKIDVNLFANIANGIVLDGFLEART